MFLTACGAQSEGGNGGGISDPSKDEVDSDTPNDTQENAYKWDLRMHAVLWTSNSSNSPCSTSAGAGPYFNIDAANQKRGESSWNFHGALDGSSAAYGKSVGSYNSGSTWTGTNCAYAYVYNDSSGSGTIRYLYIRFSRHAGNDKFIGYSVGSAKFNSSDMRATSGDYMFYRDTTQNGYSGGLWHFTSSENTAKANACAWSSGTIYLNFKKAYTIKFNPNGASGSVQTKTYYAGDSYSRPSLFSRPGYTFKGWGTAPGDTTGSTSTVTNCSSSMIYYAIWAPETYTITLNANGGKIETPINISVESVSGASYGFSHNGSYYVSQNKAAPNSAAVCKVNFTTLTPYQAVTFNIIQYAESNYDYGIFSNLDSTLSTSNTVDSSRYWDGKGKQSTGVRKISYVVPTTGTHFVYIKFRKDGSGNTGNDTLQFQVSTLNSVYLQYNTGWYYDQYKFTSFGSIGAPTRAGYSFAGWKTSPSGGTTVTNSQGLITASNTVFTANTTLYANWSVNTYYMYFDNKGGSGGQGTISRTYGSATASSVSVPTKTGHNFTGYWTAESGGTQYYNASGNRTSSCPSTMPATSVNLYAQWQVKSYSINFNQNGGSGGQGTLTCNYGSAPPSSVSVPTRQSYAFLGYYTAASGGIQYYNNSGARTGTFSSMPSNNVNLYAQWSAQTVNIGVATYTHYGEVTSPKANEFARDTTGGRVTMYYHSASSGVQETSQAGFIGWSDDARLQVLVEYDRRFVATANPGYVFLGFTTSHSVAPQMDMEPANNVTTPSTLMCAWFRKISQTANTQANKIKYDLMEDSFYFESGEFPQSYLGTSVSGLGSVSYNIPYLNANGSTVNIPVYSYSGGKCALVSGKYFKVEPIKWKVNDAVWGMYGAYNTNITAVTAEVIGFGAVAPSSAGKEGWAWTSSGMYSNTNTTAGRMSLTNANNTSVSYDKFNAAGTQTIVASNAANSDASQLRVAGLSEIKAATGSSSAGAGWAAKCSDFVAFMTTGSTTGGVYADYWTRNLAGDTFKGYHQNGLSITSSGYEAAAWLSQAKGVRYAMTMSSGSQLNTVSGTNYLTVTTRGGWEIIGQKLSVSTNTDYTISFDVETPSFPGGLQVMVLKNAPGDTDNNSASLGTAYLSSNISTKRTVSFNSGSFSEVWLVVNFGFVADGGVYTFKFSNWRIDNPNVSFSSNMQNWTKYLHSERIGVDINIYSPTNFSGFSGMTIDENTDIFSINVHNTGSGWTWSNFMKRFSNSIFIQTDTTYTLVVEALEVTNGGTISFLSPYDYGGSKNEDIGRGHDADVSVSSVGVYTKTFTSASDFSACGHDFRSYIAIPAGGGKVNMKFRISLFFGTVTIENSDFVYRKA